MCEKMSNKWDIMLSLFTNNKDTNLKREYLVYEHELVTIKQLYSVNVIRYICKNRSRDTMCHMSQQVTRRPRTKKSSRSIPSNLAFIPGNCWPDG